MIAYVLEVEERKNTFRFKTGTGGKATECTLNTGKVIYFFIHLLDVSSVTMI